MILFRNGTRGVSAVFRPCIPTTKFTRLFTLAVRVSILVFLAISYSPQISAQCPPASGGCAWNSTWTPYFTYKGCVTEARFCYRKCNGVCEVRIIQWRFIDKYCLEGKTVDDDYWRIAEENVLTALTNYVSCLDSIAGCPSETYVTMRTPSTCVEASTDTTLAINILPCDTGYGHCEIVYGLCLDQNASPPILRKRRISLASVGVCSKSATFGHIPFPNTLPPNWLSGCHVICTAP